MPPLLPKATSVCALPDQQTILKHDDSFKILLTLPADNLHTDVHRCSSFENTPRQSHTPLSLLARSPVAKQQFSSGDMRCNTVCVMTDCIFIKELYLFLKLITWKTSFQRCWGCSILVPAVANLGISPSKCKRVYLVNVAVVRH